MTSNVFKLLDLAGSCAVVVGGAGKIGLPMSEALAEAGAKVYVASRDPARSQARFDAMRAEGLDIETIALDQSSETSVLEVLDTISRKSRVPDILVNSGVERPMKKMMDDTTDNWDRSMDVNARGLFVLCRAFARAMAANGGGSIINVASIYGVAAPDPAIYEGSGLGTEPDYPFLKGGMIMFSKYLAAQFALSGVRVNCVAPGGLFNNQPEPFLSQYVRRVPMRRMACEDDMKGVALFLASRASAYITGTVIPVDGGWTAI